MSQASASSADSAVSLSFENPGDWNVELGRGPVLCAPQWLKTWPLRGDIRVEFLEVTQTQPYTKNHIIVCVAFTNPFHDVNTGRIYHGAHISMELGELWDAVTAMGWAAGNQYFPATFSIILQTHATPSKKCLQFRTFPLKATAVINTLIKPVIDDQMYHFAFLPYGDGKWKGCGDFILQWLGVLFRHGIITSTVSEENPDSLLCVDLTRTYYVSSGGNDIQISVPIGRSFFFKWNAIDDEHTPAHCYYDSPPDYIL